MPIHRQRIAAFPHVARIRTAFAMRAVVPRRGYALHPISSLRGVVVASAPHKAFDWEPSMQPSVEPAIQPAPRPVMVAAMPAPLLSA